MAEQYLRCPNCGANATNHQNCEYCGSLLVRFVEKGIDLSKTSYMSDAEVFPGLTEHLRRNLRMQKENPEEFVASDIFFKLPDGDIKVHSVLRTSLSNWTDDVPIDSHGKTEGLVIDVDFRPANYKDRGYEEKFKSLDCAQLFEHRDVVWYPEHINNSEYVIDFGEDAEGAARLISEILQKVYSIPLTQRLDVTTACGVDNVKEMRRQAKIRYGKISADEDEDGVEYEDGADGEWPWWYYVVGGLILAAIGKILF